MSFLTNLFRSRERRKTTASALEQFVQQNWLEDITPEQARRNIEEGLVEIIWLDGQHAANGILVTKDGYFLTALHCVTHELSSKRVRGWDGSVYGIQEVCVYDDQEDIALVKANIPGNEEPLRYLFYNTDKLERMPVALLTRWDGILQTAYGFIERSWNPMVTKDREREIQRKNHYHVSLMLERPGDSGGILVSQDARLVGIHCAGDQAANSAGAKLLPALELVDSYKRRLQQENEK